MSTQLRLAAAATACALSLIAGGASAVPIEISITNNQGEGGLFLTPLLTAFHDGTFDFFDPGVAANGGVQLLAEEGNPAGAIADATAAGVETAVILSPGGFAGAPVIDPGETASIVVDLDPNGQRFLSFLSMVIPSNDAFIGNGNPTAYELFDETGNFTGGSPIEVLGGEVWDAGTEANTNLGAAFNAAGGDRTDEGGTIGLFGDLSSLLNQNTAAGTLVSSVPGQSGLLATIQVASVPLPAGLPLMVFALGAFGFAARRKA